MLRRFTAPIGQLVGLNKHHDRKTMREPLADDLKFRLDTKEHIDC